MRDLDRGGSLRFFIGARLHDGNLWHLNRRSVSGGMAAGLFCAWLPMPFQMITAALLALLFRINLPLSVVMVWVSNPFTWGPMYWFAYRIGKWLLDAETVRARFALEWSWFAEEMVRIWQPLLLGSLILAVASAAAGYSVTRAIWRLHIVRDMWARRQRRRKVGAPHDHDGSD